MRKLILSLAAVVLGHAGASAYAGCASITILNAGSGNVVVGNSVEIMYSGWSGDSLYVNGVWVDTLPIGDPWESFWGYHIATLPYGNHYATVSSEPCTEDFSLVAPPPLPPNQQNVYRWFWGANNDHFHSLSATEGSGWATYEGVGFRTYISPPDGDMRELYRCWWYGARDHLVSTDAACEGLTFEGSYGWVSTIPRAGHVPLYRFYHSGTSNHLATTNYSEGAAWTYQGILGYVPE